MTRAAAPAHRPLPSLRVALAVFIFMLVTLPSGIMAVVGGDVFLGQPRGFDDPFLVSAVLGSSGEDTFVAFTPKILAPGTPFQLDLEIPGGVGGRGRVSKLTITTDHPQWAEVSFDPEINLPWPQDLPKGERKPIAITVPWLDVPDGRSLAWADVEMHILLEGVRPVFDRDDYLVEQRFREVVTVQCRLGPGDYRPTGLWNFDPYNKATWGLVCMASLVIGNVLLLRRHRLPPTADARGARLPTRVPRW